MYGWPTNHELIGLIQHYTVREESSASENRLIHTILQTVSDPKYFR